MMAWTKAVAVNVEFNNYKAKADAIRVPASFDNLSSMLRTLWIRRHSARGCVAAFEHQATSEILKKQRNPTEKAE